MAPEGQTAAQLPPPWQRKGSTCIRSTRLVIGRAGIDALAAGNLAIHAVGTNRSVVFEIARFLEFPGQLLQLLAERNGIPAVGCQVKIAWRQHISLQQCRLVKVQNRIGLVRADLALRILNPDFKGAEMPADLDTEAGRTAGYSLYTNPLG